MESIEARAFKASSLVFQSAIKPYYNGNTIGVGEDYMFLSTAGAGDDFSVDEFFDLDGLSEEEKRSSSSSSSQDQFDEGTSFSDVFSGAGFFDDFSEAIDGLAIPADDIKELELWSHLMDDTLHYDVFACPTRNAYATAGPNRVRFQPKTKPVMVEATRFPPPAITRPRTKRARHTNGSWSSSPLLNLESSSSSSVSSIIEPRPVQVIRKPVVKRSKTKLAVLENGGSPTEPVQQLKCTHCLVQKTPQWRTGPLGPKTLCNACGVRYKSGRLFPEYRPACSPTFSIEAHSNSHRKVLEMRKRKMSEPIEPALLQSF